MFVFWILDVGILDVLSTHTCVGFVVLGFWDFGILGFWDFWFWELGILYLCILDFGCWIYLCVCICCVAFECLPATTAGPSGTTLGTFNLAKTWAKYAWTDMNTRLHVYVYICVYIHVCICRCVHICMYTHVWRCMCIYVVMFWKAYSFMKGSLMKFIAHSFMKGSLM